MVFLKGYVPTPCKHDPQNQLSMAYRDPQRWKQQLQILWESDLGLLHMCHGCVLVGLLTVGMGVSRNWKENGGYQRGDGGEAGQ